MRILSIFFGNGLVSVDQDNWKPKLDKLKSVLNLWSSRELSFVGQYLILNVLGSRRFWHVAKILAPPYLGYRFLQEHYLAFHLERENGVRRPREAMRSIF